MILQSTIPLNSIAWAIGVPACVIFSIKTGLVYRRRRNPLAGAYAGVFGLMAASFIFFGLPGWFSRDNQTLTIYYYFADFFLLASFIPQSYLLWLTGLKTRISKWAIILPTIGLLAIILILDVSMSQVIYHPDVIQVIDPTVSLWLKSFLYMILPWPIAFFMIKIGLTQTNTAARTKSICIGLTYFALPAAGIANNLFENGSDTTATSIQNIFLFLTFFVITVWPRSTQILIKR